MSPLWNRGSGTSLVGIEGETGVSEGRPSPSENGGLQAFCSPRWAAWAKGAQEPQIPLSEPPRPSLLPPALPVVSLILAQNQPWENNNDIGEDPHLGSGARVWVPAPALL